MENCFRTGSNVSKCQNVCCLYWKLTSFELFSFELKYGPPEKNASLCILYYSNVCANWLKGLGMRTKILLLKMAGHVSILKELGSYEIISEIYNITEWLINLSSTWFNLVMQSLIKRQFISFDRYYLHRTSGM